ncbi:MAG: PrsW family intramembrane metalloprotease [Paludibacteraceae bacterium]|nr:PrsW family intramembrane metalloprotease [Paludibacteraceae bacterium]
MNSTTIIPLLSALIPALALLGYIYWQDRKSPEPWHKLLKATLLGVLAIPLTMCIVFPLQTIGIVPDSYNTFGDVVNFSFLGAAIPEELAKLLMLWLFLRKNPFFDERMDGIVYAVCVSLGFAGLENVMYVLGNTDWMSVALMRAFTAVPGHFCYGVIMGYFYSLAKFDPKNRTKYSILALVAPILAHGIYNTIAFATTLPLVPEILLYIVFVVFCFLLWRWASKSIKKHLETA